MLEFVLDCVNSVQMSNSYTNTNVHLYINHESFEFVFVSIGRKLVRIRNARTFMVLLH